MSRRSLDISRRPCLVYIVQAYGLDGTDSWITCVREDIDRDDLTAEFNTRLEAKTFIDDICGLMHCGGDPNQFRIVTEERTEPVPAITDNATSATSEGLES